MYSAASEKQFLSDGRLQIVVAGKSNSGKSSFINLLSGRKAARVSNTPGRTRLINYFDINRGQFVLTDLPGYGYAEAPKTEQAQWGSLVEAYFDGPSKKFVILITDIRRLPSEDDKTLISYLYAKNIPFCIVANKSDKQSRLKNTKCVMGIAAALRVGRDDILTVSCLTGAGRDEVLNRLRPMVFSDGDKLE